MEPRLSPIHQACMHLLLAASPYEFVHHAKEAVRLYSQVLEKFEHTPDQQANTEKMLEAANNALRKARSDQSAIDREVANASGKTMTDLHDAQLEELRRFEEYAQEGPSDDAAATVQSSQNIPVAQCSQNVPVTAGETQSTAVGQSQSTALTDMDDDNRPLPDIPRSDDGKFDIKSMALTVTRIFICSVQVID
ncbi:hypothetical protein LX32DRAFT_650960 [Colletotrichum zoysiae]|uniref:Uncharacterized protein n=1 Tax=Colletotrichum zoysiae TaxID=1216348 RepID=A0AAD9M767_9PEZI|nr:hypothetical protein LX32DRAFT_650960 [Colletotrichum zoysiae]